MIRFIDEYRNRFSVEFICKTLKKNRAGGFITSRGYRQSKARGLSARRLRDAVLIERIRAVHQDNYGVYGVRKMWHALRREGIDIGREQTARLMRLAGISGKGKGRSPITTRRANVPDLRPDLVEREFKAQGPNKLWVADITYVRTRKGFVYTAFVTDVYSRRIVGWALSDSMRTEALPLQALNQAIVCAEETTGLIHHSDHGSQYVSVVDDLDRLCGGLFRFLDVHMDRLHMGDPVVKLDPAVITESHVQAIHVDVEESEEATAKAIEVIDRNNYTAMREAFLITDGQ